MRLYPMVDWTFNNVLLEQNWAAGHLRRLTQRRSQGFQVFDNRLTLRTAQPIAEIMPLVTVAGQIRIVDFFAIGRAVRREFPSRTGVIVLRVVKITRPIPGTGFRIQDALQRRYGTVMQIRSRNPNAIQWRGDVSVKGFQPGWMISLGKPAGIEPVDKLGALVIALEKHRVGLDDGFRNQQIRIFAIAAVMAMALGAMLDIQGPALGRQFFIDG